MEDFIRFSRQKKEEKKLRERNCIKKIGEVKEIVG